MKQKPFMPNPGRVGVSTGFPHQPPTALESLRITLDVLPDGRISFSSSRPVPMIAVISMLSSLIKEGADTIIKQSAGIIQVPKDEPKDDDPMKELVEDSIS